MVVNLNLVKALVRHKDRYLLLKKAKDNYFPKNVGKWECPGGIVKSKETPQRAVIRETEEETGLACKIIKQLPTVIALSKGFKTTCGVYLLEASSGNVRLSDEHSDFSWVSAEHVQDFPLVLYADLLLEYFNNPEKYLSE